ncbi:MAG: alanine racemase [Planctomycetes bacterium]|nr:alanine racemase [Planctomycetota bacterium]
MSRAWVELDLEAVRDNVRAIRAVAGAEVLAVVKADGYGHGAAPVARAALEAGATRLGVATPEEAARLREAGLTAPVQLLGSFLDDELDALLHARAQLTLNDPGDLARASAAARRAGRPVGVHLKVDVGMHRHGVAPEQALEVLAQVAADPALRLEGLMTHLPAPRDEARSREMLAPFADLVARAARAGLRPPRVHAAASAALFRLPEARFDLVRPGIALVGLDPDRAPDGASSCGLTPALSLRARVTRILEVAAGEQVGYGGRWTAARPSRLALLGAGYGDGVPYALTGAGAHVLLHGRRCPLVATVMMDYLLVDVTDLPRAPAPGDVATLFGRDGDAVLPLEEQARRAGLIPYALSCGLGARLGRVVLGARTASETLRRAA